jgi:hypothetical protein
MRGAAQASRSTAADAKTDLRHTCRHARDCRFRQPLTDPVNGSRRLGEHHSPPSGLPTVNRDSPTASAKGRPSGKTSTSKRRANRPTSCAITVVATCTIAVVATIVGTVGRTSEVAVALRLPQVVTGSAVCIRCNEDRSVGHDRTWHSIHWITVRRAMMRMPHARRICLHHTAANSTHHHQSQSNHPTFASPHGSYLPPRSFSGRYQQRDR